MKLDITDFLLTCFGVFNSFCLKPTQVKEHYAKRYMYVCWLMSSVTLLKFIRAEYLQQNFVI
jgi:hypothetical protein